MKIAASLLLILLFDGSPLVATPVSWSLDVHLGDDLGLDGRLDRGKSLSALNTAHGLDVQLNTVKSGTALLKGHSNGRSQLERAQG